MRIRRITGSQQIFFPLVVGCLAALGPLHADEIVSDDGRTREGEIVGVDGRTLQLRVGAGTIGIPLDRVASVTKPAPEAFQQALSARADGDSGRALELLRPLVGRFAGLPVDWARRATSLLGDLLLDAGEIEPAKAAFERFQTHYGGDGGGARLEVGLARIDFARGEFESARERLEPVVAEALDKPGASGTMDATYGNALLLLGRIEERAGALQQALEYYLYAQTVYNRDRALAESAAAHARRLRDENPGLVVR